MGFAKKKSVKKMTIMNKISDRLSSLQGNIGVYYLDIKTDKSCFVGNTDVFPSMGIAKFLLLIEVFQRIETGTIRMEDVYVWNPGPQSAAIRDDYEHTVGILTFLHEGVRLTIRDLVMLMIVVSDNAAFNALIGIVGIENVNLTLSRFGLKQTRIHHLIYEEESPLVIEKCNHHSVQEMGKLFTWLYKNQIVSTNSSKEIIRLLTYHQRRDILPYYFGDSCSVAHQTGFDKDIAHDMGIVFSERPFVLCMSASDVDAAKAGNIMRDIVLLCHENSVRSECSES